MQRNLLFGVIGATLPCMILLTIASSCSGPATTGVAPAQPQTEPAPVPVEEVAFDASRYEEVPPPARVVIEHDAPQALLRGQTDQNRWGTRQGFRIQVLSTRSKEDADLMSGRVLRWWITEREQGALQQLQPRADGSPPVYQDFSEPYWRVRVGDFVERAEAQAVLAAVRAQFGSAFIAPARIPMR